MKNITIITVILLSQLIICCNNNIGRKRPIKITEVSDSYVIKYKYSYNSENQLVKFNVKSRDSYTEKYDYTDNKLQSITYDSYKITTDFIYEDSIIREGEIISGRICFYIVDEKGDIISEVNGSLKNGYKYDSVGNVVEIIETMDDNYSSAFMDMENEDEIYTMEYDNKKNPFADINKTDYPGWFNKRILNQYSKHNCTKDNSYTYYDMEYDELGYILEYKKRHHSDTDFETVSVTYENF